MPHEWTAESSPQLTPAPNAAPSAISNRRKESHGAESETLPARRSRIVSIDVLRGFALLGIVGANIVIYDVDRLSQIEPAFSQLPVSAAGAPFMLFSLIFVINKMMALFSMLFGAGVLLATDRPESSGRIYWRRNLILLGIGFLHSLIWVGDILMLYGLCSLVLYFFRRRSPATLIPISVVLWYWAPVTWLLFGVGPHGDEYLSRGFSMMLFGMALYRLGIIQGERTRDWYRRAAVISLGLGIPFATLAWLDESNAAAINNLGVPGMALGYVCGVMWLCKTSHLTALRRSLAAAGQMALTNYLTQTLLGFGFYACLRTSGFERTATSLGFGLIGIWMLQLCWSPIWLQYFRFGPLEWAWRVATYWRRFPIVRRHPVDPS